MVRDWSRRAAGGGRRDPTGASASTRVLAVRICLGSHGPARKLGKLSVGASPVASPVADVAEVAGGNYRRVFAKVAG